MTRLQVVARCPLAKERHITTGLGTVSDKRDLPTAAHLQQMCPRGGLIPYLVARPRTLQLGVTDPPPPSNKEPLFDRGVLYMPQAGE